MKRKKGWMYPRICASCKKQIHGKLEYIRTQRGTELFFHEACVRRGKDGTDE